MNSKRLSKLRHDGHITDSEYKELKLAIKALEDKRPKGKWILIDDVNDPLDQLNRYKCSECERIIRIYDWQTFTDYPYCQCGADMREEKKND